ASEPAGSSSCKDCGSPVTRALRGNDEGALARAPFPSLPLSSSLRPSSAGSSAPVSPAQANRQRLSTERRTRAARGAELPAGWAEGCELPGRAQSQERVHAEAAAAEAKVSGRAESVGAHKHALLRPPERNLAPAAFHSDDEELERPDRLFGNGVVWNTEAVRE